MFQFKSLNTLPSNVLLLYLFVGIHRYRSVVEKKRESIVYFCTMIPEEFQLVLPSDDKGTLLGRSREV